MADDSQLSAAKLQVLQLECILAAKDREIQSMRGQLIDQVGIWTMWLCYPTASFLPTRPTHGTMCSLAILCMVLVQVDVRYPSAPEPSPAPVAGEAVSGSPPHPSGRLHAHAPHQSHTTPQPEAVQQATELLAHALHLLQPQCSQSIRTQQAAGTSHKLPAHSSLGPHQFGGMGGPAASAMLGDILGGVLELSISGERVLIARGACLLSGFQTPLAQLALETYSAYSAQHSARSMQHSMHSAIAGMVLGARASDGTPFLPLRPQVVIPLLSFLQVVLYGDLLSGLGR